MLKQEAAKAKTSRFLFKKSMITSTIFDNTVFNIAARIQCCDLIELANNLFDHILVPAAICREVHKFPAGYEILAEVTNASDEAVD